MDSNVARVTTAHTQSQSQSQPDERAAFSLIKKNDEPVRIPNGSVIDNDDFGKDIEYDDALEEILRQAESQLPRSFSTVNPPGDPSDDDSGQGGDEVSGGVYEMKGIVDIEDIVRPSPFAMFRKKGFLSVSDLVGTVWCEVQYDYRLRTLPFLPPSQRPQVIKTPAGKEIAVDKIKVEDKERILRRGEKIHKRLEREIHPETIVVTAITREDVWGLRFLNMLSALEALLVFGKCRELPVVGFVRNVFVMGVIDEVTRVSIETNSKSIEKIKGETQSTTTDSTRQTSLTSFFSPIQKTLPTSPPRPGSSPGTHKIYISDSKTRASGTLPRESDTLAGRLQVMLYKELLDAILTSNEPGFESQLETEHKLGFKLDTNSDKNFERSKSDDDKAIIEFKGDDQNVNEILPSRNAFSWMAVFKHLDLDPNASFSDEFNVQSEPVISGNGLRFGADQARDLKSMVAVWTRYVRSLGLGPTQNESLRMTWGSSSIGHGERAERSENEGRTENVLELVYRRAAPLKREKSKKSKTERRKTRTNKNKSKKRRNGEDEDVAELGDSIQDPFLKITKQEQKQGGWIEGKDDDDRAIQFAIENSLNDSQIKSSILSPLKVPLEANHFEIQDESTKEGKRTDSISADSDGEEELIWATEMTRNDVQIEDFESNQIPIRTSQQSSRSIATLPAIPVRQVEDRQSTTQPQLDEAMDQSQSHLNRFTSPVSSSSSPQSNKTGKGENLMSTPASTSTLTSTSASGSIIGRSKFNHDQDLLSAHLDSVLGYWMGTRLPKGVQVHEASRCAWCEFEEGCEWRAMKAEEAMKRYRSRTKSQRMEL